MKRLFLFLIILGAVIAAGFFFLQKEQTISLDPSNYDATADREFWISQIEKLGAQKAYEQFVIQNNDVEFGLQHARAHVMGEALFEKKGIEGIAMCDASFGFGCFHGLFTVGFASRGQSFIQEANKMCLDRYGPLGTGCQHGIGHGIIEYVGRDHLIDGLTLCEETSQPTPLLGCTSGVFMEHNTPFTILPGVETLKPYPFTEDEPYAACSTVPEKFRESCYYELGGWWEVVLGGDKLHMGELCSRLVNTKYRNACSLGLGNIIGPTNEYSVERGSSLCKQMPSNTSVLCHAGVAWSMHSNPAFTDRAQSVCDVLAEEERDVCLEAYNLASDYIQ